MSAVDTPGRGRTDPATVIRIVVTVLLGGIGAAAGFKHTHDWAVAHGQTGWLAWADAIVIEGIAVVAGFEIHRDQHRPGGQRRRVTFPMVVLVAGFGIQMAAQVALAEPTPAGWLLAAMPALGFLVVVKLLMRRAPPPAQPPATATARATADKAAPAASTPAAETVTPAAVEPAAVEPASSASPSSGLRLSAAMTDRVTEVLDEVRASGREPTTDDVRRAIKVPEALAAQILAELPTRNGHPVATS